MVAVRGPGGRTRRGAWVGALRPMSSRGVAARPGAGPSELVRGAGARAGKRP